MPSRQWNESGNCSILYWQLQYFELPTFLLFCTFVLFIFVKATPSMASVALPYLFLLVFWWWT